MHINNNIKAYLFTNKLLITGLDKKKYIYPSLIWGTLTTVTLYKNIVDINYCEEITK